MKLHLFLFFILFSCKPVVDANKQTIEAIKDKTFKVIPNSSRTLKLYFKKEESFADPIPKVSYFVTDYQTENVKKNLETVAAEKIYWKSNTVIAVIPYHEVMKEPTEVGKIDNKNEILIKIDN